MPIIKLSDVKQILQLTDSSQDTLINYLIPIVQKSVCKYCNNYFLNTNIQIVSSSLAFSGNEITDPNATFLDYKFIAGDYYVHGSDNNDGFIEVITVAADKLTLKEGTVLVSEDSEQTYIITKIKWPEDIKLNVAQYINTHLNGRKGLQVQSETLPGGYSVTFKEDTKLIHNLFGSYRIPNV